MSEQPVEVSRLGVIRRLTRLADADGFFCVAALDHPENYLALFDTDVGRVPHATVVASKLELAATLAGHASALLLDPVWSLGQAIATGVLPGDVGVIAPIEMLSYEPEHAPGWGVAPVLRPGWTPAMMARLGVDGVKLILFYRTELAEAAAAQRKLVAELARDCHDDDLPLVIEPIWYPLDGEDPADDAVQQRRVRAIVEAAAEVAALGADILKVQFPGAVGTAAERASASAAAGDLDAGLDVPWVLLSEGAGFADFAVQMEIVAKAGASGYIAGRAVWGDAVGDRPDDVRRAGLARAAERLDTLNTIVHRHGKPWTRRAPRPSIATVATAMSPTWYTSAFDGS
jgi:tagatose-1,6-bisphosphate aldolase